MALILNELPERGEPLSAADRGAVGAVAPEQVRPYLALWPEARPTPLHRLPGAAAALGVAAVQVKDEGARLGLGSFKALGGAYAVMRLVQAAAATALSRPVAPAELASDAARDVAGGLTFCCATDGNHGKSVAAGARLAGARSVVFVHGGVSAARAAAIAAFGAEIRRVAGSYDDSVEEAARVATEEGWHVVSDTAWPGYEKTPALVMQGYTVLADEILAEREAAGEPLPTHVFLQAGVGGFAAAVAGHFRDRLGESCPSVVVVEPDRAACLFESVRHGTPVRIPDQAPTLMAMLECYQPSLVAWRILSRCADAFMTVTDEDTKAAMRTLARPRPGDPAVVAGESGAAGFAGIMAAMANAETRAALGLGPDSRILAVNTETATDPEIYRSIVGEQAEA